MKNKKIVILLIIFIFIASLGLTYSYFSTNYSGDDSASKVLVNAGTLKLSYEDGDFIYANNVLPGWSTTKTITVRNTGNMNVTYSLYWKELINEITNNELVYSISCTNSKNNINGTCNGLSETNVPYHTVKSTGDIVLQDALIEPNETQTYVITFTFKETNESQNYNQNKSFYGYINLQESNKKYDLTMTLINNNGEVFDNANVTIHSTPKTAKTDSNGTFTITDVELGSHELTVVDKDNNTYQDTFSIYSSVNESISSSSIVGSYSKETISMIVTLNNETVDNYKLNTTANKTYILTYNNNNGSGCNNKNIVVGSSYGILCTPTRDGYIFDGWYDEVEDGNEITENTILSTYSSKTAYAHWTEATYTFGYTGNEQAFTIPTSGTYKLEVWGAQGGVGDGTSHLNFGGYSTGEITLNKDTIIYINVGGQGSSYKINEVSSGGYNGGGTGGNGSQGGCGGGGATHIATSSGVLSTLSSNIQSIILVAGGGGGSTHSTNVFGGAGGGYIGNNGGYASNCSNYHATGGTQTSGGNDAAEGGSDASFGQGGKHSNTTYGGNGGGGGYYGGGGSSRWHSGAGGGSGYIGNTNLSNKVMYCYNCSTSSNTNTKTISTTNASTDAISNYAKKGNGYAKITLVSTN